jgi:hypothetical protein
MVELPRSIVEMWPQCKEIGGFSRWYQDAAGFHWLQCAVQIVLASNNAATA